MEKIVEELKNLTSLGVVGIKQSFEDEGALPQDILTMRRVTEQIGLNLSIKIGGCEAKTDIQFCKSINADKIVAPMVETSFALTKFIESIINIPKLNFYVNIESKTAYENLDNILSSPSSKLLSGIVIGRSDLTKSYGFGKDYVDSPQMQDIVYKALVKCKEYNITTLMGGNISSKSSKFVKKLYKEKLLEYIETRNVIIKLNNKNINNIASIIKSSLIFESKWLQYKANYYNKIGKEYTDRSNLILNRI